MYGVLVFITCLASTLLIFKMAKKGNKVNVATLLIIEIAVSSFLGAFTSFAMYLIGEDSFKITMWMMGYLRNATWKKSYLYLNSTCSITDIFLFQKTWVRCSII